MGFCKDCGAEVSPGASVCGSCGSVIGDPGSSSINLSKGTDQMPTYSQNMSNNVPPSYGQNMQYNDPPSYGQNSSYGNTSAPNDSGSVLWGFLGCCIPIVGLVLFLVWKDTKPNSAKAAGIGALVSVVLSVIFYAISFAIGGAAGIMG